MGTTLLTTPPPPMDGEQEEQKNRRQQEQQQQQQQLQRPNVVVAARMISSSIGSVITAVSVHPLEVIKVRLQAAATAGPVTRLPPPPPNAFSVCCSAAAATVMPCGCGVASCQSWYSSSSTTVLRSSATTNEWTETMTVSRRIVAQEGVSGLYRGIKPTLMMAVPNTVVYYTLYDAISEHCRSKQQQHSLHWTRTLLAGSMARFAASCVTAPLEYLRTVQAASMGNNSNNASVLTALKQLYHAEGGGGGAGARSMVFKGLEPLLWRDVPFSAIYWVCLEQLRNSRSSGQHYQQNHYHATLWDFLHGALAGTVAACCTTPADVAKTRLQTSTLKTNNNSNIWITLQQIAQEEGIQGLWRGNLARVLKVAPSCAIMIGTYELGKRTLLQGQT